MAVALGRGRPDVVVVEHAHLGPVARVGDQRRGVGDATLRLEVHRGIAESRLSVRSAPAVVVHDRRAGVVAAPSVVSQLGSGVRHVAVRTPLLVLVQPDLDDDSIRHDGLIPAASDERCPS